MPTCQAISISHILCYKKIVIVKVKCVQSDIINVKHFQRYEDCWCVRSKLDKLEDAFNNMLAVTNVSKRMTLGDDEDSQHQCETTSLNILDIDISFFQDGNHSFHVTLVVNYDGEKFINCIKKLPLQIT